ncbi:hypothetical protein [Microbacterium sediminis]|uniref:hypothetical protein n=1 Tax=Microbacterium sediminis TaxID=904291 RepID=UPI0010724F8E|nr:hypothetical protein [Microbacterium sediminis]QBR73150.1 hypothetical protein E3O41_00985 [Microbacterium sediminis]
MAGEQIEYDYGVLDRAATSLTGAKDDLATQAGAAGRASVATDSFGILNAFLGQVFAQLPEWCSDALTVSSAAAGELSSGVRGMIADFQRADADARDAYTRAEAHIDAAERLL